MFSKIMSFIHGLFDWFYSDSFKKKYDRSSLAYRTLGLQITADLEL